MHKLAGGSDKKETPRNLLERHLEILSKPLEMKKVPQNINLLENRLIMLKEFINSLAPLARSLYAKGMTDQSERIIEMSNKAAHFSFGLFQTLRSQFNNLERKDFREYVKLSIKTRTNEMYGKENAFPNDILRLPEDRFNESAEAIISERRKWVEDRINAFSAYLQVLDERKKEETRKLNRLINKEMKRRFSIFKFD